MRIEAYKQIQQLYSTNKAKSIQKTDKKGPTDQVQISSLGQGIQVAKSAVVNAPDIREDVVNSIKAKMANGSYSVDVNDFATRLIG